VPGVVKVTVKANPYGRFPESNDFAPLGTEVDVTVCETGSLLTQVTLVPTFTENVAGMKGCRVPVFDAPCTIVMSAFTLEFPARVLTTPLASRPIEAPPMAKPTARIAKTLDRGIILLGVCIVFLRHRRLNPRIEFTSVSKRGGRRVIVSKNLPRSANPDKAPRISNPNAKRKIALMTIEIMKPTLFLLQISAALTRSIAARAP
jgi:hypothetical protein